MLLQLQFIISAIVKEIMKLVIPNISEGIGHTLKSANTVG